MHSSRMVHQGGLAGPASPSTDKHQNSRLKTPHGKARGDCHHHGMHTVSTASTHHPHACRRNQSLLPQNLEAFPKFGKCRGHSQAGAALPPQHRHRTPARPGAGLDNRPFVPLPQKVYFVVSPLRAASIKFTANASPITAPSRLSNVCKGVLNFTSIQQSS